MAVFIWKMKLETRGSVIAFFCSRQFDNNFLTFRKFRKQTRLSVRDNNNLIRKRDSGTGVFL